VTELFTPAPAVIVKRCTRPFHSFSEKFTRSRNSGDRRSEKQRPTPRRPLSIFTGYFSCSMAPFHRLCVRRPDTSVPGGPGGLHARIRGWGRGPRVNARAPQASREISSVRKPVRSDSVCVFLLTETDREEKDHLPPSAGTGGSVPSEHHRCGPGSEPGSCDVSVCPGGSSLRDGTVDHVRHLTDNLVIRGIRSGLSSEDGERVRDPGRMMTGTAKTPR